MNRPISMPKWLYTDETLNEMRGGNKLAGWEPDMPVSWMTTSINLARPHAYDRREDHFDCLVQYRVDALDTLAFNGITAGELVVPKTEHDPKRTTLLDAAERSTKTTTPDGGLSLGRIVTVDAIYHDSWCAIPWLWRCPREAVFGHEAWEQLVNGITIGEIKSGSTVLTPLKNVTSPRVALYSTAHHAMWRIGTTNFFVVVPKRRQHHMLDASKVPEGWSETVERYSHPPSVSDVPVDPSKRLKGTTLRSKEGDATMAIHEEMLRRGINTASTWN